ncbi:hypothetical protein [Eikenella longinqua]|uniref:hypothetical protein n=2 Tax=Eikenella TaxID=538 RepID=UPI0012E783DC|nr:hypothetical protein [Eikenella longinqua]
MVDMMLGGLGGWNGCALIFQVASKPAGRLPENQNKAGCDYSEFMGGLPEKPEGYLKNIARGK